MRTTRNIQKWFLIALLSLSTWVHGQTPDSADSLKQVTPKKGIFQRTKKPTIDSVELRTLTDSVSKVAKPQKNYQLKIKKQLGKPSKAALLSGIFPGMGQVYNGKYWKVPIALAGVGFLGYTVGFYHTRYIEARDNLFFLTDGNEETQVDFQFIFFTEDNLRRRRDRARRDRDYYIILTALAYGLVVADAAVDGHLNQFDVSDDLSLALRPSILPLPTLTQTAPSVGIPALSLTLTIR